MSRPAPPPITVSPPLPAGLPSQIDSKDASQFILQEHEKLRSVLTDWMVQQRKLYMNHMAQQQQLMEAFLGAYTGTFRELGIGVNDVALESIAKPVSANKSGTGAPVYLEPLQKGEVVQTQKQRVGKDIDDLASGKELKPAVVGAPTPVELEVSKPADTEAAGELDEEEDLGDIEAIGKKAQEQTDAFDFDGKMLECWIHCSGLHTVEKLVKNYRKHPAGWAALLMIHGIPEVTGRLRSKVENYAIYSALFLSVSIGLLTSPPSFASADCPDDEWWECQIRKRLYLYFLAMGTASHMLSIMLGMSFINALNEAARDSDIYRMFSRGKGFLATVKCEKAFGFGCLTDFAAMVVSVQNSMGWDAVPLTLLLLGIAAYIYRKTSRLLFQNASLVMYWREELGGKPDKDDPYDLAIPISCFNELAKTNRDLFMEGGIMSGSKAKRQAALWASMRAGAADDEEQGKDSKEPHDPFKHHHGANVHASAVAALF